jgi:nucleoside-diphosphate kinase
MEEVSFGIVKPHAYGHRKEIEAMVESSRMEIVARRDPFLFTRDLAELQYGMHREKFFYEKLMEVMTAGPVDMFVVYGDNAIQSLIDLAGDVWPSRAEEGTIRRLYGVDDASNAFHRADSRESAKREINLYFKDRDLPDYVAEILETY